MARLNEEQLLQKKAQIEKQLAQLRAREATAKRKEQTRLKILIGGGIMADIKLHPQLMEEITKILDRSTKSERDRKLLIAYGWIKETANQKEGREEAATTATQGEWSL